MFTVLDGAEDEQGGDTASGADADGEVRAYGGGCGDQGAQPEDCHLRERGHSAPERLGGRVAAHTTDTGRGGAPTQMEISGDQAGEGVSGRGSEESVVDGELEGVEGGGGLMV